MQRINRGQIHDFAGKTAAERYLSKIDLNDKFVPPYYADSPMDLKRELDYFKALHYIGYRLEKSDESSLPFWQELYFALRNKIVYSHFALIHDCIKKSSVRLGDYDEMISVGSEAIMSASEAFDPWRGFKFSTYAYRSILYRFSSAARKNKVLPQSGLDASDVDISAPEKDPNMELRIERVALALENADLTEREKGILNLRFKESKTLGETSQNFGLSKERVRQIQVEALAKLKRYLKDDEFVK